MKKFVKNYLYYIAGLLFVFYLYSFLKFLNNIEDQKLSRDYSYDIVVITGGSGRIKTGAKLLSNSVNSRLLISGVGMGVKRSEILSSFGLDTKRVDLGYNANSTRGNAIETKNWVKKNGFKKIVLVTDNWHLPRAKLLFEAAMPDIKIIPHSVFVKRENNKGDLGLSKNIMFLIQEHIKYLISHLQAVLLRMYL